MRKFYQHGVRLALLGALILANNVAAEQALSLTEALDLARRHNDEIKLAEADTDVMAADARRTLAVFLPQVAISEMATRTNDPLNVFGYKLKQEIVSAMDFDPTLLNDPANFDNYMTKVEVKQPIFNADGFFGRRAALAGLKAMRHKETRTMHYISLYVKQVYYQLVLARQSLRVIAEAQTAARAYQEMARNYSAQGLLNQADLLRVNVRVLELESQQALAGSQAADAEAQLCFMLGMTPPASLILTDSLTIPVNVADSAALNVNRSDWQAMQYRIKALQLQSRMQTFKLLPNLNAFANLEWNDDRAFGGEADAWMAGIVLQWNIFNGFESIAQIQKSKAELKHAHLEYDKMQRQTVLEADAAWRKRDVARQQIVLADESVKQAAESLRITADRYAQGLEKTTDLLSAEATLSNMRLQRLKALFEYKMAIFNLELIYEQNLSEK